MTAKYYTQFRLTEGHYRDGNEFSGIVELNQPIEQYCKASVIEALLAKNFDLNAQEIRLVSWARLH